MQAFSTSKIVMAKAWSLTPSHNWQPVWLGKGQNSGVDHKLYMQKVPIHNIYSWKFSVGKWRERQYTQDPGQQTQ